MNNLGRGSLDDATYQISFWTRRFLKFFPYLCKTSDPRGGFTFYIFGYNLNNLGRGPLDDATYPISKATFRQEDF